MKAGYEIGDAVVDTLLNNGDVTAEEVEGAVKEAKKAWTDAERHYEAEQASDGARRRYKNDRSRHRRRSQAVKVRFQAAQSRQSVSTSHR